MTAALPDIMARASLARASAIAARASAAARAVRRASISGDASVMDVSLTGSASSLEENRALAQPAAAGRQVCRGFRQSIPSSR